MNEQQTMLEILSELKVSNERLQSIENALKPIEAVMRVKNAETLDAIRMHRTLPHDYAAKIGLEDVADGIYL